MGVPVLARLAKLSPTAVAKAVMTTLLPGGVGVGVAVGVGVGVGEGVGVGFEVPASQIDAFITNWPSLMLSPLQPLKRLLPGAPVPSSIGELSPVATNFPAPQVPYATITLKLVCDAVVQTAASTLALLVGAMVKEEPWE